MSGTLDLTGYKLTFDDEFNSYDLNNGGTQPGVWNTYFTGYNVRTLSGNGEQEYYSDPSVGVNPFSQQNGELTITASPGSNSAGLPYNSGTINTEGTFSQTYGYFEMRAELPQGQGMWPAFWMLPTSNGWPPELDALEAFGQTNANGEGGSTQYHVGEISANSSQNNGGWETVPANIYNSYNTYGVKWTPENVTYYFDGQQVAQFTTPADMSQAMYLIANLAAGGNWPGDPNGETAQMKIDYIRAFSDSSSATAVNLQTVSAPDGGTSADMADFTDGASAANVAAGQTAASDPAPSTGSSATSDPTPVPSPTPMTAGDGSSSPSDGPTVTPVETRAEVAPDQTGTATGTSSPSELTATADGQTLIGNGGDDIFNIGGFTHTSVVENGQGVSEVDTSAASYTLPAGINNLLATDNGNHALTGNGGNNIITGGSGNDVIDSGGGTAILTGGGGSDTFVMNKGYVQDTITDFNPASDVVDLNGYGITDINTVGSDLSQHGADTWLVLPDGGKVVFQNVEMTSLTPADFALDAADPSTGSSSPGASSAPGSSAPGSSDGSVIPEPAAQPMAHVARDFVVPDDSGTATGTSTPSVLLATGAGQTLAGHGGDDIFVIGDHADAMVTESAPGTSTVITSAASYTLPTGIANLTGTSQGSQILTGNAGDNYITTGNGNNVVSGGGGNDTFAVGTGANILTGSAGHDLFVFSNAADHGNVITDFSVGQDELDLTGLLKSANYQRQDPVADHVLQLVQSGNDTNVVIDPTGHGGAGAHTVVTLENVIPSSLKAGHDYVWHA